MYMYKKIITAIIIVLCLGFISCKETIEPTIPDDPNGQEPTEPHEPNIPPEEPNPPEEPTEPEIFFEGPIVISTCSYADNDFSGSLDYLDITYYKRVSYILLEADIIFVGKVPKNDGSAIVDRIWVVPVDSIGIEIEIIEVLKGATNEKNAKLIGLIAMYFYERCQEDVNIFFISKDGEVFVFPTAKAIEYGALSLIAVDGPDYEGRSWYETIDDIKLLWNACKKNRELFSKAGKQDLLNLYPQLSYYLRYRFLLSLAFINPLFDEHDLPILLEWRQMEIDNTDYSYESKKLLIDIIGLLIKRAGG